MLILIIEKPLIVKNVEKGGVFEILVNDINKLRDSINGMLSNNKSTGLILQDSSSILLNNVDTLSKASNEAAASLEEIAAALAESTESISHNTNNVVQNGTICTNCNCICIKRSRVSKSNNLGNG